MAKPHLTSTEAHSLFAYEPDTGVISWKVRRNGYGGGVKPGDRAGHRDAISGYIVIRANQRLYPAHRIAWLLMEGDDLPEQIDHRDGDRANNRWENLRAATHALNQQNRALKKSASGMRGVHPNLSKWQARITINRKCIYLGTFDTREEAAAAYLDARARRFAIQPVPRELLHEHRRP